MTFDLFRLLFEYLGRPLDTRTSASAWASVLTALVATSLKNEDGLPLLEQPMTCGAAMGTAGFLQRGWRSLALNHVEPYVSMGFLKDGGVGEISFQDTFVTDLHSRPKTVQNS